MKHLTNILIVYMSLSLFCVFVFSGGYCKAEVSPVHASKDYSPEEWNNVQFQLESLNIQQILRDFGMNQEEISTLFQQFNPEDIHKVALNVNQLVPAGDGIAIVVGILIIIILVIVILKLLNKEIIVR